MLGPYPQGLCPLLPGHVTRLVGVPDLLAVVAELGVAAIPLTRQLGAAGTAVGDHRVPGGGGSTGIQTQRHRGRVTRQPRGLCTEAPMGWDSCGTRLELLDFFPSISLVTRLGQWENAAAPILGSSHTT